jgi:hypothetical protein
MIEKETKIIITKKEEESIVKAICDQCAKNLVLVNEKYIGRETDALIIDKYIELRTFHNDWGNDSLESLEKYQFCCINCCLEWIKEHKKELESDTRHFEIKCNGIY